MTHPSACINLGGVRSACIHLPSRGPVCRCIHLPSAATVSSGQLVKVQGETDWLADCAAGERYVGQHCVVHRAASGDRWARAKYVRSV